MMVTNLKEVEAITMTHITVNVALSPVAILTIARAMRIKLNGLEKAVKRRTIALGGRSVAHMLGPCLSNPERAPSADNPRGLEPG
jgi:hypothetical protein